MVSRNVPLRLDPAGRGRPGGEAPTVPRNTRSADPLKELYERPGFLLRRAHQINSAIFDEELGAWEITHTQYGLLMAIASYKQIDLVSAGRLTAIDRTTTHLAVKNLERRGWITRCIDPDDARRHLVAVTPAGTDLLRRTKPALQRVSKRLLATLSSGESDSMLSSLARIVSDAAPRMNDEPGHSNGVARK